MSRKKEEFDPTAPGILAHRAVQVLNSATYAGTRVPVFRHGITVNLSLMDAEAGSNCPKSHCWLRIHRSPDPFTITERSKESVRLQYDWIWLEIATGQLENLFAKAEAVKPGCTEGWR